MLLLPEYIGSTKDAPVCWGEWRFKGGDFMYGDFQRKKGTYDARSISQMFIGLGTAHKFGFCHLSL